MTTYRIYASVDTYALWSSTDWNTARQKGGSSASFSSSTTLYVGTTYAAGTYSVYEPLFTFTMPAIGVTSVDVVTAAFEITPAASWPTTVGDIEFRKATDYLSATQSSAQDLYATLLGSVSGALPRTTITGAAALIRDIGALGTIKTCALNNVMRSTTGPTQAINYKSFMASETAGTTDDPALYITVTSPSTWGLYVDGINLNTTADLKKLVATDSGRNGAGSLRATFVNSSGTVSVPAGSEVALYDGVTGGGYLWVGPVVSRRLEPILPSGNLIEIEATDRSSLLGDIYVPSDTIADGISDQAAIQYLVDTYGTASGITAPTSTVQSTREAIPGFDITGKSLREALELVADAAVTVDASGVEWLARSVGTATYSGVTYNSSGTAWVAVSFDSGTVLKSTDSLTWSTAATAVKAWTVAYGNSVYVAASGDATTANATAATVYWSSSGTAWSSATLGTAYPKAYATLVGAGTPVAYYRLNDASGTVATATYGTNGAYVGSPTLGTAGALADSTDKAVYFSGGTQYVSVPLPSITGSYTVEAWAKPADSTANYAVFGGRAKENTFDLQMVTGTTIHADIGTGTSWLTTAADCSVAYSANTWYHIAYVVTPTSWTGYVNGTAAGSGTYGSATPMLSQSGTPVTIAQTGLGAGPLYFKGSIDEVAIYTTALSSATILAHYQSGTATRHGTVNWRQAAYGTAGWVLVGNDGTRGFVGKSTTGTASWSITNELSGTALTGVAYAGGTYVAVAGTAAYYSASGTAWSTASVTNTSGYGIRSVATDGTTIVLVGDSGSIWSGTAAAGPFATATSPVTVDLGSVAYWPAATLWAAVGAADTTLTSPNASDWTDQSSASFNALNAVAAGSTHLVAVGSATVLTSSTANTSPRSIFTDVYGQVNYGVSTGTAPYAISDTPDGTSSIAATDLEIDYDESNIVNRVYVASAESDWLYGGWVEDATSLATYGQHEAFLIDGTVTDTASITRVGQAYLADRKDPQVRGSFRVANKHGWRAGQTVTITNSALGLSAAQYQITEVVTEFLTGSGSRAYRVSFGGLPRSLVRAIAAGS